MSADGSTSDFPPPPPPPGFGADATAEDWSTFQRRWIDTTAVDAGRVGPDTSATPVDPLATTAAAARSGPAVAAEVSVGEERFQRLKRAIIHWALAFAVAVPLAFVACALLALIAMPLVDRSFGDSFVHVLAHDWYALVWFAVVALPVTFTLVRIGPRAVEDLVIGRRYWKALVVGFVVVPAIVALSIFALSNALAVLIAIIVLITAAILIVTLLGGM